MHTAPIVVHLAPFSYSALRLARPSIRIKTRVLARRASFDILRNLQVTGFSVAVHRYPACTSEHVEHTACVVVSNCSMTGGEILVGQSQLVDKLRELARNLWWAWQPNVIALFRELDPALWRKVDHNPVEFLKRLPVEQLERRAAEMALDSRIDYAFRRLAEYLKDTDSWGAVHATILRSRPVAYFSAEFGLHESLPIYSGGLGVLAGDHLKSASDLGIPLIGVGLLYAQGYFRQTLDANGWQQELYLNTEPDLLPIESVTAPTVSRSWSRSRRHRRAQARVWRVEVGRTMLLLLDSNVAREQRVGPVADRAALRRRRPGADSPGAASGRRRRPGAARAPDPSFGPASQRRA